MYLSGEWASRYFAEDAGHAFSVAVCVRDVSEKADGLGI